MSTRDPGRFLNAIAIVMAATLLCGSGHPDGPAGADDGNFWGDIADPGRRRFNRALKEGIQYYKTATRQRGSRLSPALLEQLLLDVPEKDQAALQWAALIRARKLFKDAVAASPKRAGGHLYLGKTYYLIAHLKPLGDKSGPRHDLSLMKKAVASLTRARVLDSAVRSSYDVAFKLAIAYSTLGEMEQSIMEYERAERIVAASGLSSSKKRGQRSLLLGNAAECLMGLGRLDEAILRYQEALALGSYVSNLNNHWGLAVAYDRDEQASKAMAHARKAMSRDKKMNALTSPDIFFVPRGEVHYYFAIGHLAQGELDKARFHLRAFLKKLPESQWAARARARLAQSGEVQSQGASPGKKRLAPVPGDSGQGQEERDRAGYKLLVRGRLRRVQRCFSAQLRKKKDLSGRMQVGFQVGKEGKARRLRVLHATLKSPGLKRCMFNVIRKINFVRPSSGKVINLKYTFDFRPRR